MYDADTPLSPCVLRLLAHDIHLLLLWMPRPRRLSARAVSRHSGVMCSKDCTSHQETNGWLHTPVYVALCLCGFVCCFVCVLRVLGTRSHGVRYRYSASPRGYRETGLATASPFRLSRDTTQAHYPHAGVVFQAGSDVYLSLTAATFNVRATWKVPTTDSGIVLQGSAIAMQADLVHTSSRSVRVVIGDALFI